MTMSRAMGSGVSGLMAHQFKMDSIGDNLANVNTTAFKGGRVLFMDMFSQTVSSGSGPTATNGGINPKQIGLGVLPGQVSKNFSQGILETTGIPSDLAVEGEGFFILENDEGKNVYTRDGAFARNIFNDLVNPATGFSVQGYNATFNDGTFNLTAGGALEDLNIPVGEFRFARQTTEVQLNGIFNSDGNPLATEGSELVAMSDMYILGTTEKATAFTPLTAVAMTASSLNPLVATTNGIGIAGGSVLDYTAPSLEITHDLSLSTGTQYLVTMAKGDGINQEFVMDGSAYTSTTGIIDLSDSSIISSDLTSGAFGTDVSTDTIFTIQQLPTTTSDGSIYTPLTLSAKKGGALLQKLEGVETSDITFLYGNTGTTVQDYMEWLEDSLGIASSAGASIVSGGVTGGTATATDATVILDDETAGSLASMEGTSDRLLLKVISGTGIGQSFAFDMASDYDTSTNTITYSGSWATAVDANSKIVIQRMTAQLDGRVDESEATPGTKLTEFTTTAISASSSSIQLDPTAVQTAINDNALHVGDIIRFTGSAGDAQGKIAIITDIDRTTGVLSFTVDGTVSGSGLTDDVGAQVVPPSGATLDIHRPTGVTLSAEGEVSISGNLGVHNDITELTIEDSDNLTLIDHDGTAASGESAVATFSVFDSTGNEKEVKVTFYLEGRGDNFTSLRWIAESANDTDLGAAVASHSAILGSTATESHGSIIGQGQVVFDQHGQFQASKPPSSPTLVINTEGQGAGASMSFNLNFADVNALSDGFSDINMSSQDGLAEGVLDTFSVNVDGTVMGIFSNGAVEAIAQVALARFNNPQGLDHLGNNLFGLAPNSGPAQVGAATTDGRGSIRGGALEASNVDLAQEFTNLITTQRGFQANARTITTADELLVELVNLKR